MSSTRGWRAMLRAMKVMVLTGIFEKDDSDFRPAVFAFLESSCAARCYGGSTLHRPLAAPRASELVALEGLVVEEEATALLAAVLAMHSDDDGHILGWILFARSLSSSASSVRGDVEGVVKKADERAALEASRVLEQVGQVRWQLKSLSILLATGALDELLRRYLPVSFSSSSSP